jgi:hypothetical protein
LTLSGRRVDQEPFPPGALAARAASPKPILRRALAPNGFLSLRNEGYIGQNDGTHTRRLTLMISSAATDRRHPNAAGEVGSVPIPSRLLTWQSKICLPRYTALGGALTSHPGEREVVTDVE